MTKQPFFSTNKDRVLRKSVFTAMCFLTLFGVTTALKHNIFRDQYIFLVNVIIIISLVFLTVLTGYVLFGLKKETLAMSYFSLLLIDIHLAVFFGSIAYSLYHTPNHVREITVFFSLSYFFLMGIFLSLWMYQKQFLMETALTRAVTVLIKTALLFYTIALIVNLFEPILFMIDEEGVLSDNVTDYISIATDFFCLFLLCVATIFSNLRANQKFSFLSCIFVPIFFTILYANQNLFKWNLEVWGIMTVTIILPLCLIFFNAHDELENDVLRHENEETQLRMSAMISQMQPHFLYNSLAVIEALCEEDPQIAAKATNAFASYLRENMDFANKTTPISFSEELNHIKTYVWLEKLRFPNKLFVEYDINCIAFSVPALSVQPMVENAIKHGICKSKTGGTVRITTYEADQFYCVTISDDGTGFDIQNRVDDGKQHLGINNTRYRIAQMVGGTLNIESKLGEGTTIRINIPK